MVIYIVFNGLSGFNFFRTISWFFLDMGNKKRI
jgi:hypothetical protein